jgi:hypothetical protein
VLVRQHLVDALRAKRGECEDRKLFREVRRYITTDEAALAARAEQRRQEHQGRISYLATLSLVELVAAGMYLRYRRVLRTALDLRRILVRCRGQQRFYRLPPTGKPCRRKG